MRSSTKAGKWCPSGAPVPRFSRCLHLAIGRDVGPRALPCESVMGEQLCTSASRLTNQSKGWATERFQHCEPENCSLSQARPWSVNWSAYRDSAEARFIHCTERLERQSDNSQALNLWIDRLAA
jgi:hypothetical protein